MTLAGNYMELRVTKRNIAQHDVIVNDGQDWGNHPKLLNFTQNLLDSDGII